MCRDAGVVAFIVLIAAGTAASARGQGVAAEPAAVRSYDAFMSLSVEQKRQRFDAMSAEDKAVIVRTHAAQWLQRHRAGLSTSEVDVFEAIIAFIDPELYQRPSAATDGREEALLAKMRCRVSPQDVHEAMHVFTDQNGSPVSRPRWTYLDRAQCWFNRALEGVAAFMNR